MKGPLRDIRKLRSATKFAKPSNETSRTKKIQFLRKSAGVSLQRFPKIWLSALPWLFCPKVDSISWKGLAFGTVRTGTRMPKHDGKKSCTKRHANSPPFIL